MDEFTTIKYSKYTTDNFIYEKDEYTFDFEDVDFDLNELTNPEDILTYIESNFLEAGKNRFALK